MPSHHHGVVCSGRLKACSTWVVQADLYGWITAASLLDANAHILFSLRQENELRDSALKLECGDELQTCSAGMTALLESLAPRPLQAEIPETAVHSLAGTGAR